MTSKEFEDICIGFDEYGFEPSTLCDSEEVINQYRKAFKDVLKDLEILEILKKWFMESITDYRDYDMTLFVDRFIRENEPIYKILEEWLDDEQRSF